jgi:hypothetical protein
MTKRLTHRGSLLAVVARCEATARDATSRAAHEADVFSLFNCLR